MPHTKTDLPKCPKCGIRNSGKYPGGICRNCYDVARTTQVKIGALVPNDIAERVKKAQTKGDWRALADSLADVVKSIASGETEATAAQASMLKHIMDRAYGRVSKSQEDKQGPIGIVILPTIHSGMDARVCKRCLEAHLLHDTEQEERNH